MMTDASAQHEIGHHEVRMRGHDDAVIGSERAFGLTFAAVFGLAALYCLWHGSAVVYGMLAGALVFLGAAMTAPAALRSLNRLWFRFGLLLHKVTTPVTLGLLFFVTIVPIGLVMRAFGRRPLQIAPDPRATTYWATPTADPSKSSLKDQF